MKTCQVLVVDDDYPSVCLLESLFQIKGLSCVSARSSLELEKIMPHHDIKILFLDLFMPGNSGFTVAQSIRSGIYGEEKKDMHIVAVSSEMRAQVWPICKEYGFNAFIQKPVDFSEIYAALNTVGFNVSDGVASV